MPPEVGTSTVLTHLINLLPSPLSLPCRATLLLLALQIYLRKHLQMLLLLEAQCRVLTRRSRAEGRDGPKSLKALLGRARGPPFPRRSSFAHGPTSTHSTRRQPRAANCACEPFRRWLLPGLSNALAARLVPTRMTGRSTSRRSLTPLTLSIAACSRAWAL